MPQAAIYTRVSSPQQGQEGTSLETQLARCQEYAARCGYAVVATYRDVHTGGDLLGRRGLTALRDAVRRGQVDVVIAYAVDRLTRDIAHLHFLVVETEAAGSTIEIVTERLTDTPEGKLLQSVRAFVAEVERLKIAERFQRGIRARLEGGRLASGAEPYGYRWRDDDHGAFDRDETTAPVVRRIFGDLAGGGTLTALAANLTAEGVPTPRRGRQGWSMRTLSGLVRNPVYKGELYAHRWRCEPTRNGNYLSYLRPPEEWIRLPEGAAPALVDAETWEAANAWVAANQQNSTRDYPHPAGYLLRGGIVHCGLCGLPLLGRGRRGDPLYYRCTGSPHAPRPCATLRKRAAVLDGKVWDRVLRTAARGGPPHPRTASWAGRCVVYDIDDLAPVRAGVDREIGLVRGQLSHLGHEPSGAAILPTARAEALRELTAALDRLESERTRLLAAQERRLVLDHAWQDLVRAYAADPAATLALGYDAKRAWLERLGIAVRVWPLGHGRQLEVTSVVDLAGWQWAGPPQLPPASHARVASGRSKRRRFHTRIRTTRAPAPT